MILIIILILHTVTYNLSAQSKNKAQFTPLLQKLNLTAEQQNEFDNLMSGVGFKNYFLRSEADNSITVLSHLGEKDPEYEKIIKYHLASFKDIKKIR